MPFVFCRRQVSQSGREVLHVFLVSIAVPSPPQPRVSVKHLIKNKKCSLFTIGRFDEEAHSLTPAFCNRLFEVVHTYEGRLDYKGYLDLVVSLQALRPASAAPASEAALRYFWRVLNLHDAPSLGSAELSYFARPAGRERPLATATAHCPGRLGRAPQATWLRHGTWGDEPRGAAPQASAAPVHP